MALVGSWNLVTLQVGDAKRIYFKSCGGSTCDVNRSLTIIHTNLLPLPSFSYVGCKNCSDSIIDYIIGSVHIGSDDDQTTLNNPLAIVNTNCKC